MDFIISFEINDGVVQSLNKTVKRMVFSGMYNGVVIKSIGSNACANGKVEYLDLSNTEIISIFFRNNIHSRSVL